MSAGSRLAPAKITSDSRRAELWEAARREAKRLQRAGCRAVAVSGSLARGDCGPSSDVDLWAIADRSGREERWVEGVPLTVFFSRPSQLSDWKWVNRWDVEALVVLFDRGGDFRKLHSRYLRRRAGLLEQARQAKLAELHTVRHDLSLPPAQRDGHLAWLEFSLAAFEATAIRAPKWRHAVALLSANHLRQLRRRLRFPARIDRSALIDDVLAAPGELERLRGLAPSRWASVESHLERGEMEEAILKLRHTLEVWATRPLCRRSPILRALHRRAWR